ncbi:MAG: MFS transporter [Clostridia bacterium]|nr:MFS transporter [Clostridia bacterium]
MKLLNKKWKIILYGCSGLGLNMLNIIIGTHLCNALIESGFDSDLEFWTYESKTLVVIGVWSVLSLLIKALDGLVDIPLATFTDNLRTRWGRRRPAILMGYIPLLLAYVLFLFPLNHEASILNTIWFALLLGIFYSGYTLTMVTYYATFAEIVGSDKDRVFLSTVKSICDVAYFSLNFALVPLFVSLGVNIRYVALIFLPLALTMLIPLFMIKEPSTKEGVVLSEGQEIKTERVNFIRSLAYAFRNKRFIFWLCIVFVMNIGLQLFLGGISVFFSNVGEGLNMTLVMASSFVPVPFTLLLYNWIMKKRGLKFAFQYILLVFSIGMSLMMFCYAVNPSWQMPVAIGCALIVSFSIGAFFSITYTVPSQMAAEENQKGEVCTSSMYFAVQGLFEGVSAALAGQVVLVFIRTFEWNGTNPLMKCFPLIVSGFCMIAFFMAFFLPKSISAIGKEQKNDE